MLKLQTKTYSYVRGVRDGLDMKTDFRYVQENGVEIGLCMKNPNHIIAINNLLQEAGYTYVEWGY